MFRKPQFAPDLSNLRPLTEENFRLTEHGNDLLGENRFLLMSNSFRPAKSYHRGWNKIRGSGQFAKFESFSEIFFLLILNDPFQS
jgi:hypothetical protein